jgi:hypothetical protein
LDNEGRLVAHADDYQIARHLLAVPIARQLGGRVSDGALRFLDRLRGWVAVQQDFTAREAKTREEQSKSSVYGWLSELHEAGLLEKVEGQRGRSPATWRRVADSTDPTAAAVLPPVETVCP